MNIISELLLSFLDIAVISVNSFDPYKTYGKSTDEYLRWRQTHHTPKKDTGRLIREGYVKSNGNQIILTDKAKSNIAKIIADRVKLAKKEKWDGVFRVVVFDIPEEKKSSRNQFRNKLKEMGFEMIQKSVFCHPHDCTSEIIFFSKFFDIEKCVSLLEVTSIITDRDIFKSFRKKGFL